LGRGGEAQSLEYLALVGGKPRWLDLAPQSAVVNDQDEFAAQDFAFDGQAAALFVIQQDAAFAKLLPKHLVLGSQVFNDLLLLLVDPPSKDEMEQLPGLKNEIHGRPGAVKEDGLASGPGMALSIGRKAFGSAESPRDQHPQLACRFLFAARLNSFTIRVAGNFHKKDTAQGWQPPLRLSFS
jgi:hypothetical protein